VREILPGIQHWTAFHEGIGIDVSSYYVPAARALIDPMSPPGGIDALAALPEPQVILLTNRHHYRHSAPFAERYGCPVRCHESGLHEFEGGSDVTGFSFGDEVAPGVTALELGAICPDDSVLHLRLGAGVLAFADGLVHWGGGKVGFVPDRFMGDDPEGVKRALRISLTRLLEPEFDALLFAHGDPIPRDGKQVLRAFLGA